MKGKEIVYVPEAEIIHVHEETEPSKNRFKREAIALRKIEPVISINLFNLIYLILLSIFSDLFSIKSFKS